MMAQETYLCPYCCSDVTVQATVCAHCGRELVLIRAMALQLKALTLEVEELKQRLARPGLSANSSEAHLDPSLDAAPSQEASAPSWNMALGLIAATVLGTALAHWLLLFVYDVRPLFLRLATIGVPAALAFLMAPKLKMGWRSHAALSVVIGVGAVAVMLGITALIDKVPWWPESARDLQETIEFMVAIALSCWTGNFLFLRKRNSELRNKNRIDLSLLLERDEKGQLRIGAITQRMQSTVEAMTPIVSGVMALYSGLKAFTS